MKAFACALGLMMAVSVLSSQNLRAAPLAFGVAGGAELPFYHAEDYDPGLSAEAFWRKDPYELRFHYAHVETQTFSVLLAMKYFFSDSTLRPYFEVAAGPTIIDPKGKGLAYGVRPEASFGADLGVNRNFSINFATRYYGTIYFGDTQSGKWEANHGLNVMVGAVLWF